MILAYILSATSYLAGVGLNVTSGWLITMASFMPPVLTLSVAVVMVRFFGIARSASRYGERVVGHSSVLSKLAELRSDLYRKITAKPLDLLRSNQTGQLVKQVVDDVERTQEYELRVELPGITALITLFSAFCLALWLQPSIAVIWILVFIIMGFVIPTISKKILLVKSSEIEKLESLYADRIRANSLGYLEAENYGYLESLIDETNILERKIELSEIRFLNIVRIFQFLINLIVGSTLIFTILFIKLPAVQVAMLIFLALTGFEATLAWYPNLFSSGKLLNAKSKLDNLPEVKSEIKNRIEFGALIAENFQPYWDRPLICPLSFKLNRGDVLVLRGVSGVGKTTTAMGILGFTNYNGSIKINGEEINRIENLSDLVVGSLQNGHIFNTSIEENLRISGDENKEVLKLLELEDLINSMPDGLATIIGQYGRGLSGGEMKRLNLARALMNKSPILILDEPLEHLDPMLAERIEARILENYRDRILIIITHTGFNGLPEQKLEQFREN